MLSEGVFGLVLLDISLLDGNGVILVEWLCCYVLDIYIVMVIIFDDDDYFFIVLCVGVYGYFLKD